MRSTSAACPDRTTPCPRSASDRPRSLTPRPRIARDFLRQPACSRPIAIRGQAKLSEITRNRSVPVVWVGDCRQPSRQQRPLCSRSRSGGGAIGQAGRAAQAIARRWSAEDEVMGQSRTRITKHPPIAPPTESGVSQVAGLPPELSPSGVKANEQWDRCGCVSCRGICEFRHRTGLLRRIQGSSGS